MKSKALLLSLCLTASAASADDGPVATTPVHPAWAPLLLPAQVLVPGVGHLIRGERRTGLRLLATTGVVYALTAGAAVGLVASGGSDQLSVPLIPVLVLVGTTALTLGASDAIGTFTNPISDGPPVDYWDRDWRARAGYLYAPNASLRETHFLEGLVERRWRSGWIGAQLMQHLPGGTLWYGVGGGYRLLGFDETSRAGLYLEAMAGQEHNPAARYDSLRARAAAAAIIPFGRLAPTLADVTSVVRLGVQPSWTGFAAGGETLRELYLIGGFELRWAVHPRVRLVGGYEHGRDGPIGGSGTGFIGVFHGGAEVRVVEELWLTSRVLLGNPNSAQFGLERRW